MIRTRAAFGYYVHIVLFSIIHANAKIAIRCTYNLYSIHTQQDFSKIFNFFVNVLVYLKMNIETFHWVYDVFFVQKTCRFVDVFNFILFLISPRKIENCYYYTATTTLINSDTYTLHIQIQRWDFYVIYMLHHLIFYFNEFIRTVFLVLL